jgi:hypothetical protein
VTVTLADRNGLEFVVHKTGAGCHQDAILTGHRFTNMRDRLDGIGGTLTVQAQPGAESISRPGPDAGLFERHLHVENHSERTIAAHSRSLRWLATSSGAERGPDGRTKRLLQGP